MDLSDILSPLSRRNTKTLNSGLPRILQPATGISGRPPVSSNINNHTPLTNTTTTTTNNNNNNNNNNKGGNHSIHNNNSRTDLSTSSESLIAKLKNISKSSTSVRNERVSSSFDSIFREDKLKRRALELTLTKGTENTRRQPTVRRRLHIPCDEPAGSTLSVTSPITRRRCLLDSGLPSFMKPATTILSTLDDEQDNNGLKATQEDLLIMNIRKNNQLLLHPLRTKQSEKCQEPQSKTNDGYSSSSDDEDRSDEVSENAFTGTGGKFRRLPLDFSRKEKRLLKPRGLQAAGFSPHESPDLFKKSSENRMKMNPDDDDVRKKSSERSASNSLRYQQVSEAKPRVGILRTRVNYSLTRKKISWADDLESVYEVDCDDPYDFQWW